jgi:hypothetical protein
MNMREGIRLALLLAMVVLVAADTAMAGRPDKSGTSAGSELLIPVGARNTAMGGASTATAFGVEAIYWNPAGLPRTDRGTEAMFSHMEYFADIGVEYFAVATSFEGFGSIGLSLKTLSFGDLEITTATAPDGTGQFYSPTYVTAGFTYGLLLTDRISVGATVNLITERIDRVEASAVAFDFGVQYSNFANVGGLTIAVAARNIGSSMQFTGSGLLIEGTSGALRRPGSFYQVQAQDDELPSVIELGLAYSYALGEENILNFSGVFQNNNLSEDEYKLGVEYEFNDVFFLRGGYSISNDYIDDAYPFGFTAGAGVKYAFSGIEVGVDYAYRDMQFFDGNHTIALRLGF